MSWRAPIFAIALLVLVAAPAAAQDGEATVNESDFDTSEPETDESYLEDDAGASSTGGDASSGDADASADAGSAGDGGAAAGDDEAEPTLGEGDFDTSAPAADESYLDDAETEAGLKSAEGGDAAATPGVAGALVVGVFAGVALALRRR